MSHAAIHWSPEAGFRLSSLRVDLNHLHGIPVHHPHGDAKVSQTTSNFEPQMRKN